MIRANEKAQRIQRYNAGPGSRKRKPAFVGRKERRDDL
jgi:hypothetical protein